ncbi:myosin heavy chain, clone 203-like [Argopecten irradians]|uniref:myosin heavy chain, clone 203-like n=1 Tax=Argopecten irradians TaxID=31199 RepID=UPI0037127071
MSTSNVPSSIPLRTSKKAPEEAKKTTYMKSKQHSATGKNYNQLRKGFTERKTEKEKFLDETTRLQNELSEYKESVAVAQRRLDQERERLSELQKHADEKENRLSGEIQELQTKNSTLEEKTTSYEKKLLLCNINPVTLEHMNESDTHKDMLSKRREAAKESVSLLKKRVESLNKESSKIFENMKNLGADIDKIVADVTLPPETT